MDLVGCDVQRDGAGRRRSLGYAYNGTNADAIYGTLPPALGIDVLKGPVVLKVPGVGIDTLGLTSFVRFIGGVDPSSAIESYNWMRGFSTDSNGNPDPIVDPFGDVTKFMFAGDPFARAMHGGQDRVDWVDQNPSDRRMLLSSGPFSLAPGESQDVVVAILVGQCGDRLNSLRHLDFVDAAAHEAFNLGFEIPAEPRPPAVTFSSDHGTVTLGWDRAVEAEPLPAGYTFEGYNIYQGATIAGPWRLVTTLDARDGIRELDGPAFNVGECESLPLVPLAHGTDIGLASSYSTSQDFVNGTTLKDGSDYYYAVTTYVVNPAATPGERVVESPLQSNVVRPQREAGSVSARQVLPLPTPTAKVDLLLTMFVDSDVPTTTRNALISYANGMGTSDEKTRGLLNLILALPSSQLN